MTKNQCSNLNSFGDTPPYFCTYVIPPLMSVVSNNETQMHYLRFPTPPTTPHKEHNIKTSPIQIRTQSVIMKVNNGSSHHVADVLPNVSSESQNNVTVDERISSSGEFSCNWIRCKLRFQTLEALVAHVTQIHSVASMDDGLYYCMWENCPRSTRGFNARYKMLVHVRVHTKEKPHQCHLCMKSFSRAENLKIHFRSHSGERPYCCTFEGCQRRYSNSSDRFKHTRTHSMEKPYMCKVPGCHKKYTDPSSLRKHVKTFNHNNRSNMQHTITESIPKPNNVDENSEKFLRIRIEDDVGDEENCSKASIYLPSSCVHTVNFCNMEESVAGFNYFTNPCHSYWIKKNENTEHFHQKFTFNSDLPLDLRTKRK